MGSGLAGQGRPRDLPVLVGLVCLAGPQTIQVESQLGKTISEIKYTCIQLGLT